MHGTTIAEKGGTRVTVGRDCRDHFRSLCRSGHCRHGVDGVARLRYRYLSHAAALFFFVHLDVDGGIKMTASHNPSEYNGFKTLYRQRHLYGQQIQDVRVKMERNEFQEKPAAKLSAMKSFRLSQAFIAGCAKIKRPLKVVVDAGSGVGGPVAPPIFRQLGCTGVRDRLHPPTATFPIHHPDPTVPENLEMLIEKVKTRKRISASPMTVMRTASAQWTKRAIFCGATSLVLFSRDVFKRNPGRHHLRGQVLEAALRRHRQARRSADHVEGRPFLVKAKMKETHACWPAK